MSGRSSVWLVPESPYRAVENDARMVCSSFWMCWDDGRREKYQWPFPAGLFEGDRLEREFYPLWFEDRKTGRIGLVKAVWCKLFDRALLSQSLGFNLGFVSPWLASAIGVVFRFAGSAPKPMRARAAVRSGQSIAGSKQGDPAGGYAGSDASMWRQ